MLRRFCAPEMSGRNVITPLNYTARELFGSDETY
jgi:hypothetical protein